MTAADLCDILKDLKEDEFQEFTWYLQQHGFMKPYPAIKESKLEKANRLKTVDLMVKTFERHGALEVTRKVLQKIPRNDLLQSLPNTSSGPEGQSHFSQIRENLSPEKSINLFHCLNELNDGSLVEEIQQSLSSGRLSTDELSPALCSALIFISLSSGEHLDVLDQKNLSLVPVAKASNKALLSVCNLSERSCGALSSVLSSPSSSLRELDLSHNDHIRIRNHLLPMVEPAGDQRLKPGLRKYACELTIDTNTMNRELKLSYNNRKVTCVEKEKQPYPDHPDRFDYWFQLLCRTGLTGRCYWEVKWRGHVKVSVSYRGIRRKGTSDDCVFGLNDQSWSLECSAGDRYSVYHNKRSTRLSSSPSSSGRVAVYVDWPAGSLSFYRVSSDTLILLYTFRTTFTERLYPAFGFGFGSSVSLCSLEERESTPL